MPNNNRELFLLSLINKEMYEVVSHQYRSQFLYERAEHCLRRFIAHAELKPSNTMAWYFHVMVNGKTQSLSIQKLTPKNKCKHKSMMVFQQLVKEQSADLEIVYAIDTHIQCVDECLDCFKEEIWPYLRDVKFAYGCAYKRADLRKGFDDMVKELTQIISSALELRQQQEAQTQTQTQAHEHPQSSVI
jgi:hypothetical protein